MNGHGHGLDCPEWMGDDARREWSRIVDRLSERGVLGDVEPTALEAYCRAYETWNTAEQWIAENGAVANTRNDKGEVKGIAAVPQVGISARAAGQMRQFLADCGLTPATSEKVPNGKPDKPTAGGIPADDGPEATRRRLLAGLN